MTSRPQACPELLVSEMDGEGLVYDFRSHKAHCLNATAFAVFRQLDGRRSVADIGLLAGRALGQEVGEEAVVAALQQLDEAGLLVRRAAPAPAIDLRRRRALKKMALTAGLSLAVPAVWSIVAPTAAHAASLVSCSPPAACMSNNTCCGTPGGPAMTCSTSGNCGNNASNSPCRNATCS